MPRAPPPGAGYPKCADRPTNRFREPGEEPAPGL
jgi:hypothetical protein